MIPEKATMTPVISAPTTKTTSRNLATGMPRVAAVSSPIVMALSCLTTRRGYVVLMWLGTLIVPTVVSTVAWSVLKLKEGMASGAEGEAWTNLLSIVGSLAMILKKLVGYGGGLGEDTGLDVASTPPEYLTWAPWLVVLALFIAAGAAIHWRTSKLEGIA
jgi:hypothetical protein